MSEIEYRKDHIPEFFYEGWKSQPWFKFWINDWMGNPDIKKLTYEDKGFYTDLLNLDAHQGYLIRLDSDFSETSTPKSPRLLSDFFETSAQSLEEVVDKLAVTLDKDKRKVRRLFKKISDRFIVTSQGYVINRRGEKERSSARKTRDKSRKKAGKNPEEILDKYQPHQSQSQSQIILPPNPPPKNPPGDQDQEAVVPQAELDWKLFEKLAGQNGSKTPGGLVSTLRKKYSHPDETDYEFWKTRIQTQENAHRIKLIQQAKSFVGQTFRGVEVQENGFDHPKGNELGFIHFSRLSNEKLEEFINEVTQATTGKTMNGAVKA